MGTEITVSYVETEGYVFLSFLSQAGAPAYPLLYRIK